ncbi:MAG: hypothetical protein FJ293_04635 [Planctomycetes bacterium]|nr:hypothetical protein [Planctomycetota bacterium]
MRTRSQPLRLHTRLGRVLALFAWLAVTAQAVGVPIHLAVEEHSTHGRHSHHVHFGRFGHHGHPHRHDGEHAHADAVSAPAHAGGQRDGGDPGARPPHDAPCQREDIPALPPHSALDHLIDTVAPRTSSSATADACIAPTMRPITLPPLSLLGELARARDRVAPERPPPRRPEQSRAPPSLLV